MRLRRWRRITAAAAVAAILAGVPPPAEAAVPLVVALAKLARAARTAVTAIAVARPATTAAGAGRAAAALRAMPAVRAALTSRARTACRAAGGAHCNITAAGLYRKMPVGAKACGREAVEAFMAMHDVSHIRSSANRPDLAGRLANVVWEDRAANRARGGRDMTPGEFKRLRTLQSAARWC